MKGYFFYYLIKRKSIKLQLKNRLYIYYLIFIKKTSHFFILFVQTKQLCN